MTTMPTLHALALFVLMLPVSQASPDFQTQPFAVTINLSDAAAESESTEQTRESAQESAQESAHEERAIPTRAIQTRVVQPPRQDRKFAERAVLAGNAEVALSRVARARSTQPSVKAHADRILADHAKAGSALQSLAIARGLRLASAPDRAHRRNVKRLQTLTGDAFDQAYIRLMIADHAAAVNLFERQAHGGRDADLKAHASRRLPDLREHLEAARVIGRALMGPVAAVR